MTPQDISRHLDISWDLANDIQKRRLQRKFSRPKLKHLKRLAVDEVYVGKRHKYLTLVLDRFHVVKLYNEKLTKLRRELYREATDMLQKNVLKGTRWLLLMNAENLNEERDEPSRLEQALLLNAPLAKAYYLKDELRQFWKQDSKPVAERHLDSWCTQAEQTGIRVLQQMAKTLRKHRASLLAWYDDPISTGPLEGVNNKLKLMQREAFGYRDLELLKLRILSLHTTHKSLVG
jgi:transposase